MRNTVFLIEEAESKKYLNEGWQIFYYISLKDFLMFLKSRYLEFYVSIDNDCTKPLQNSNYNLKRNLKKKFQEPYNNFYFSVSEYSDIKKILNYSKLGTTLLFFGGKILEKYSENKFYKLMKKDKSINDLEFFVAVHDFDWQSIVYFKDENVFEEFKEWIRQQAELKISNDWDSFK